MKTLRFIGVALLTVLMSVSFSACGGDDDDNGGGSSTTTIEGTWYLKSEIWYGWKGDQPDMTKIDDQGSYDDYSDIEIWTLKRNGDNYDMTKKEGDYVKTYSLIKTVDNEYALYESGSAKDRIVIKSVTANKMVVDRYRNYYNTSVKQYAILTFMK